jgi:hypothetical protein
MNYFHRHHHLPLLLLNLLLVLLNLPAGAASESTYGDDVCFNGCSGHGKCHDFVCECYVGYFGADCRHTFVHDTSNVVPVLGAGHFNLTSKSFAKVTTKHPVMLVGFSSRKCHKCISHEADYERASVALKALGVPFARANADKLRAQLADAGMQELPALVVYKKGRPHPYIWLHSAEMIVSFVKKQLAPAVTPLDSVEDVLRFVSPPPPPPPTTTTAGAAAGDDSSEAAVEDLASLVSPLTTRPPGTTAVVGFFSDPEGMEEDEHEEFVEAVAQLQTRHDVVVGCVTSKKVAARFKDGPKDSGRLGWIDRSPAVVVARGAQRRHLNLDEFYASSSDFPDHSSEGGLEAWIVRESLPLVDALTPRNFPLYEKLGLPMMLLFLELPPSFYDNIQPSQAKKKKNKKEEEAKNQGSDGDFYDDYDELGVGAAGGFGAGTAAASGGQLLHVGGSSGGVANDDLLGEFLAAAEEHRGRIAFVYLDGVAHADQMTSLGLFGGAERLPAIAFNTKDSRQMPFSERLPINRDTLLQFCADFLSGRLQTKADAEAAAKKALTNPSLNMKNLPTKRKPRKKAPAEKRGVSEQFRDNDNFAGNYVMPLNRSSVEGVVMDERRDVVIMFHSKGCEPCAHLAVYYKRVAQRFHELGLLSHGNGTADSSHHHHNNNNNNNNQNYEDQEEEDYDDEDEDDDFEDDDFEDNKEKKKKKKKKNPRKKTVGPSLVVARMDVTDESPPGDLGFRLTTLPSLVILPAKDKSQPYRYFSGVAKVLELMQWVEAEASTPLNLPPLAHLRESDRVAYKEQVAEREAMREERMREEQEKEEKEAERRAERLRKRDELKRAKEEQQRTPSDEL